MLIVLYFLGLSIVLTRLLNLVKDEGAVKLLHLLLAFFFFALF